MDMNEYAEWEKIANNLNDLISCFKISDDIKSFSIDKQKALSLIISKKYSEEWEINEVYGGNQFLLLELFNKKTNEYKSINLNDMEERSN